MDENKKKYNEYLKTHISNVKKCFFDILDILADSGEFTPSELKDIKNIVENHDRSKYSEEEYYPYLRNFYPENEDQKNANKKDYDSAWNHHQKSNPHHWQYWILIRDGGVEKILDMDKRYVIEMLCDWGAFKYVNPDSTAHSWYEKMKDKMKLSDNTRKLVEKYLKMCPNL